MPAALPVTAGPALGSIQPGRAVPSTGGRVRSALTTVLLTLGLAAAGLLGLPAAPAQAGAGEDIAAMINA